VIWREKKTMNISVTQPTAAGAAFSSSHSASAPKTETVPPPQVHAAPASAPKVLNLSVETHFDDMSGTLVASVVNPETGNVVTEVPPEALRALAARTVEFRGKLMNLKV